MTRPPRRPWSWLADNQRRARIVLPAQSALDGFHYRRIQRRHRVVHRFVAVVHLPGYPDRTVTLEFSEDNPLYANVFADGPNDSPHRFADRGRTRLCLWHYDDPEERRWVPDDGLLELFGMAAHHLFKEAWWRETETWIGEEYPHEELGLAEKEDTPPTPTKNGSEKT